MNPKKLYELLKKRFGEAVISVDVENSIPPKYVIQPDKVHEISEFLKNTGDLEYDQLMCLTGQDLGNELSVVLNLFSTKHYSSITLEAKVAREHPELDSVSDLYATANWHEREAYDMLGVVFKGHPNMKRILLPDDWEGYPLRKDYKPADAWHGMPISKELSHKHN
ncbi:MAG TPA: NADH-quinone oxidoreductase subunit C [Candidatus Marinimicrobia bacterium]|nr:NADH-quinone oxidoreductase subunit C [Candidatus Neomarinimicrobiota bacterium]